MKILAQSNRGNYAHIETDLCKGCRLCVQTCPRGCLRMGTTINKLGYPTAEFVNATCTACGMCFYACPEPAAVTVYKDEPLPEEILALLGSTPGSTSGATARGSGNKTGEDDT